MFWVSMLRLHLWYFAPTRCSVMCFLIQTQLSKEALTAWPKTGCRTVLQLLVGRCLPLFLCLLVAFLCFSSRAAVGPQAWSVAKCDHTRSIRDPCRILLQSPRIDEERFVSTRVRTQMKSRMLKNMVIHHCTSLRCTVLR